jgi:hypothetical protein
MVYHDSAMCLLDAKLGVKKASNHAIVVRWVKAWSVAQVTAAKKLYASYPNHGIERFVDDKTAAKKARFLCPTRKNQGSLSIRPRRHRTLDRRRAAERW